MFHIISPNRYLLSDHAGGFDQDLRNVYIDSVSQYQCVVSSEYCVDDRVRMQYPNICFEFDYRYKKHVFKKLYAYNQHPMQNFKRFLCSFNGGSHISRKFLTAALYQRQWFDIDTCTKNFTFTTAALDGHIADFVDNQQQRFYRKFFIDNHSESFFSTQYSIEYTPYDHINNIYNLEQKITQSFLHLVSETLATSYYPFVTEKFLLSVITRGLFLAYAQPGWHSHLQHYYGFRLYDKIFDYRFDSIKNPVERLIELMSMISKFSTLSKDDWGDLYEIEKDTIEYNYNHYFSDDYLKCLARYE